MVKLQITMVIQRQQPRVKHLSKKAKEETSFKPGNWTLFKLLPEWLSNQGQRLRAQQSTTRPHSSPSSCKYSRLVRASLLAGWADKAWWSTYKASGLLTRPSDLHTRPSGRPYRTQWSAYKTQGSTVSSTIILNETTRSHVTGSTLWGRECCHLEKIWLWHPWAFPHFDRKSYSVRMRSVHINKAMTGAYLTWWAEINRTSNHTKHVCTAICTLEILYHRNKDRALTAPKRSAALSQ